MRGDERMYNNGMFWFTLICLLLLTAVFIYQMKIRLYGGTSVFHKIWCLIRGAYYKVTSVAGFGITKLQSKNSREPEEELLNYPLAGGASQGHWGRKHRYAEGSRESTRAERRERQYKMKILR